MDTFPCVGEQMEKGWLAGAVRSTQGRPPAGLGLHTQCGKVFMALCPATSFLRLIKIRVEPDR